MTAKRSSTPSLQANRKKIVESVLFLIQEAEKKGQYVTTYDVVKSIFVADVAHLNTYGRPITFDNYYAMKDGPVPSIVYGMLCGDAAVESSLSREIDGWPLWQRVTSPADGANVFKFIRPKRSANLRALSQTDVSALRDALSLIKAQSFAATRDMTHEYVAYKEAWAARGDKNSCPMRYELLLDQPDVDLVEDLAHASHYS